MGHSRGTPGGGVLGQGRGEVLVRHLAYVLVRHLAAEVLSRNPHAFGPRASLAAPA